ncbi:MAG: SPFH domain-containing protein [Phycisphaerae bacterium]
MKPGTLLTGVVGFALVLAAVAVGGVWMFCRVYVEPDQCLVLIRKSGAPLPAGEKVASAGQKGVQRETLGPGRYFFNPFTWDWELHRLVEVAAGDPMTWREVYSAKTDVAAPLLAGDWPQIGVLVNKVGKPAPDGAEVVEAGFQGIQRHVLTPGTYRINPYVYEVRLESATVVPLGYCGVVTSQLGDMPARETVQEVSVGPDGEPIKGPPKVVQKLAKEGERGVLANVLPPGIYYLNPYVYKVQIVQVGYNQLAQEKGRDIAAHITFPSRDGFTIDIGVTVVWGRHPAHTAEMINRFGDLAKLREIILSQMRSICRNIGSEYESTDFIRGEKRELYQQAVTETLRRVCRERDIEILIALIHNIEVQGGQAAAGDAGDLKSTIQRGFIAREQEISKQAEREAARKKAELETAAVAIEVAREQITADTRKKVAELKADGEKKAREIDAQRDLEVSRVEREIADLEAENTRVTGRAAAEVEELRNQAEADGKRLMIEAFGAGRAYNLYTFAEGFAPESIRLIFAGEGTFWTDLQRAQDAANLELLRGASGPGTAER